MTEHPTIHNDERMISQMGEQKSAKRQNCKIIIVSLHPVK